MNSNDIKEIPIKQSTVGIVGGGRGCAAILDVLRENPAIKVEWVADIDPAAIGIKKAKKGGIPGVENFHDVVTSDLDIIINVTGSQEVGDELKMIKGPDTELMGGASALFMWQLADERRLRLAERDRVLREHENLYHLGLVIENIDSLNDAGLAIMDYGLKMLKMPAGSLAIFDEEQNQMKLVASKGFSREFEDTNWWEIRQGGLTSSIFNQNSPLYIKDLEQFDDPNPLLLKEGVKSVVAAPLVNEGQIVGILYVNDFKVRTISSEDMSIFSLLTVYASLIIERAKALEATHHLSIADGLTALYNHRHVMRMLKLEHRRAFRYKTNFSVMMLDVDHFKQYNDTFGHLEGNKVLRDLAKIFMCTARDTDIVARFGGEEFCIVAPELDKCGAESFAERLLRAVSKHDFPNREVTISGGVATFPDDADTVASLLETADKRLYIAKERGRIQICLGDKTK